MTTFARIHYQPSSKHFAICLLNDDSSKLIWLRGKHKTLDEARRYLDHVALVIPYVVSLDICNYSEYINDPDY